MDYKKLYEDALERAKKGLALDKVFPELNEDEETKEIIAWLGKGAEQIKPYWVNGKGVFVPVINKIVGMENLGEMSWDKAIKKGEIGSRRDWRFIVAWKEEINALLEAHGCDILEDVWYWTSDQYNAAHAWIVNLCYGYVFSNSKTTGAQVRLVSAFNLNA